MANKTKWVGTLSTTERNHIGLIQVRMNNVNSETFGFDIIDGNGEVYDLKNRKVLFCTYFDRYAPIEQYAQVVDTKGKINYTMTKHDMQKPVRINFAYFKIVDTRGDVVDTTQNFSYDILPSIESSCMNAEPYIIRLEEVLDVFTNVRDEAMKEIQTIIKDFNEQVVKQQKDFDLWFKSVKEIIESIDPGGLLLSEIIESRSGFNRLNDRLNWMEKEHYLTKIGEINSVRTLVDNNFSKKHKTTKIGNVQHPTTTNPIIIATVDDDKQNRFKLKKVGEI